MDLDFKLAKVSCFSNPNFAQIANRNAKILEDFDDHLFFSHLKIKKIQ
jgi:hypothetical protein